MDNCKYCHSTELTYSKWVYEGRKQKAFHFIANCDSCSKSYCVERSKEVFEKVKDIPWSYPKHKHKVIQVHGLGTQPEPVRMPQLAFKNAS